MNREIAMKWVADLRTPGLKQATGKLRDGDAYCCLGRLCIVVGVEPASRNEILPVAAKIAAEMYSEHAAMRSEEDLVIDGRDFDTLAVANDAGIPFAQIADWIEQNYERL